MTPQISEDEYRRNRRLAGIFSPYALKQIDDTYGVPETVGGMPPQRFVHYTTAEAALKMIKSKRVWMRNTLCMTDYREVQHGFDLLLSFFADKAKTELFYEAFDLAWPGAAREATVLFDGWLPDLRANTYVASLSKHHNSEDFNGRLSMWRGFGSNSVPRVAIVLKVPYLSGAADKLQIMFSPVAYLDETKVQEVMLSIIAKAKEETEFLKSVDRQMIIAYLFQTLLTGVVCLKHEGFKEEVEWRAIYSPNRRPSPFVSPSTEIVSGVPQIVYNLPLDGSVSPELAPLDFCALFDRLIIGPSQFPLPMYGAFVDLLKSMGVADADKRVCCSLIPIRG